MRDSYFRLTVGDMGKRLLFIIPPRSNRLLNKVGEREPWPNSGNFSDSLGSVSDKEDRQEALIRLFVIITVHEVMCHVL